MEYHYVDCSNCGQKLRLSIDESRAGKTVEAICPTCRERTKVVVPPASQPSDAPDETYFEKRSGVSDDVERAMNDIKERIQSDPVIRERLRQLRQGGYTFAFALALFEEGTAGAPPEPSVDEEGKVKEGVFTDEDRKKFKEIFRINLDE